ncbi:MAG: Mu-like prophage protein Com, partial [Neobacillus sp.]|nr:Mu-like prophage protein Com [Neobacillus sp.]
KDYINEITEESQEEGGTMKSSELKELRCTCGRLLGKSNSETEIVCPRCRNLMVFDNGKLINGVVVCK